LIHNQTQSIMKKLLVLSMVLSSFVSYSQVIEKQTTYVIKMTEQEYQSYLKSNKKETTTTTKTSSTSYYKPRPTYSSRINDKSFGLVGGYSMFMGSSSFGNMSWGTYVDLGKFGIEYNASVGTNMKDIGATNYINGKTDEWVAGGTSRNIGVFTKYKRNKNLTYGGGVQFTEIIGVKNTTIPAVYFNGRIVAGPTTMPSPYTENSIFPYVTIGYITKLGDNYSFKGSVIVSKISMANIGFGYNF
jgi:hypothetical protein